MDNVTSFMGGGKSLNLEHAAFIVLMVFAFLLPVFFLPFLAAPFQFTKTLIIIVATLVALFLLVVARLREGSIVVPTSLVMAGSWLIALAYILAALFGSSSLSQSFIGQRFETDTAVFMIIMALLLTVTPLIVRTKEQIVRIYLALMLSAVVLALYQLLRLFLGADFLTFNIFTTGTANLLGKWNDLGIFFGLMAALSLMALDGFPFRRLFKIVIGLLLVVSVFFLAVINFLPVWIALGLLSLGLFVHGFFKGRMKNRKEGGSLIGADVMSERPLYKNQVSIASLIILVISLLFIFQGDTAGEYLSTTFNISQVEARPSWTTTIAIAGQTYRGSPVFGAGPNMFQGEWALFKPVEVNTTAFWNVDFTAGIGTIPTSFVTVGALGALAWIAFFLLILYTGYRGLISAAAKDTVAYHISLSAFVATIYLWTLTIVYVPNAVLIALAFFFTGIFLATLRFSDIGLSERRLTFSDNPRLGFVSVLLLTVLLIATIVGLYSVGQRYAAAVQFQQSVIELNLNGNVERAAEHLDRAVLLGATDNAYRFATQIGLVELNRIVGSTEGTIEERRAQFQQVLSTTIRNGQLATEIDPDNYQNWFALGDVYRAVVPLQIEGAYDSTVNAYNRALELSPKNPSIELALAQLEIIRGDVSSAREHIERALALKGNYTEAIFLLSQLQIQQGQVAEAMQSVEAATLLAPGNPVFLFQLGLLRFNVGDDAGAVQALERAVALNDVYANARYFLGLAYYRLGQPTRAVEQFEVIQQFNEGNQEVEAILTNLREGRAPFEGVNASPVIEERESLPIGGE